jgi:dimethylargininase
MTMSVSQSNGSNGLLAPFTRALVRWPAQSFSSGLTTRAHLGLPDYQETFDQFGNYLAALRRTGLEITDLPADGQFPDAHFVEDPAVIFGDTAFICRPAFGSRRGEEILMADALSHLNLIHASEDASIEGGDVLFCRDRVLIGLSRRTNRVGAEQLASAIQSQLGNVRVDFVPFTGVLHLKTGLTEIAPGILVHDPQMVLQTDIPGYKIVTLPAEEGYAASVLPINNHILIADGFPTVAALAAEHYNDKQIYALPMSEIEKMDGGLTCLSLRY